MGFEWSLDEKMLVYVCANNNNFIGRTIYDGAYCPVLEHRLCCQVTDLVCVLSLNLPSSSSLLAGLRVCVVGL